MKKKLLSFILAFSLFSGCLFAQQAINTEVNKNHKKGKITKQIKERKKAKKELKKAKKAVKEAKKDLKQKKKGN